MQPDAAAPAVSHLLGSVIVDERGDRGVEANLAEAVAGGPYRRT